MKKMKLRCVQLLIEIYSDHSLEMTDIEMTRKHCIFLSDIIKWPVIVTYLSKQDHMKFTYEAMKHHSI